LASGRIDRSEPDWLERPSPVDDFGLVDAVLVGVVATVELLVQQRLARMRAAHLQRRDAVDRQDKGSTAPSRTGLRNLFECHAVANGPVSDSPSPTITVTIRSGLSNAVPYACETE